MVLCVSTHASGSPVPSFSNADVPCAWPVESTPLKANVAYPDSNATYWTTPYIAEPGLSITVSGTFPSARFFGIDVYSSDAQSIVYRKAPSSLSDFQIVPDAGSQNPWVTAGALNGGTYTVRLSRAARAGSINTLPIAPRVPTAPLIPGLPRTTGFVMLRVYLPQGGNADDASVVPLPSLTFRRRGSAPRTLMPCARAQATARGTSRIRSPKMRVLMARFLGGRDVFAFKTCDSLRKRRTGTTTCPPPLQFFRAGGTATPFPNAISGYAAALYTPARGYITVVRAQMPQSAVAAGSAPAPWPGTGDQLRYWSVCNYVYKVPFPVVKAGTQMGCLADQQFAALGPGNTATVAISSVVDRPVVTRDPASGIEWLPTSPTATAARELVAVRNMLAAPGFEQGAMDVGAYNSPSSAAAAMGPYYPSATQCTTATFAAGGVEGCFQSPASPAVAPARRRTRR